MQGIPVKSSEAREIRRLKKHCGLSSINVLFVKVYYDCPDHWSSGEEVKIDSRLLKNEKCVMVGICKFLGLNTDLKEIDDGAI